MHSFEPAHPGSILHEYIQEETLSDFSERSGIPVFTLQRVLSKELSINPDFAKAIARALPVTNADFWMGLQRQYDDWNAHSAAD